MGRKTMIKYSHEEDKKNEERKLWEMKYSYIIRSSIKRISMNSIPMSSSSRLVKLTIF